MNTVESSPEQKQEQKPVDNSMGEFYQLRNNLLIGTIVIALVSFILVWVFYSLQTSLSYLLGACVSLVYLNMLAKEVERVGVYKQKIGSTRLALFAGLMVVATQWQQLQLLPVFLGFLTYKVAIFLYVIPTSLLSNLQKTEKKG